MRTNINIDELMNDVLKTIGLTTKKDAVELALSSLIRLEKQEGIKSFRGQLKWLSDLDEMRNI